MNNQQSLIPPNIERYSIEDPLAMRIKHVLSFPNIKGSDLLELIDHMYLLLRDSRQNAKDIYDNFYAPKPILKSQDHE